MRRHQEKFLLLLILILAFFLRFWRLAENPPSLNWDEVSHGYNAYSILKAGKDEWGVRFPTIFRAFGDYKLPVYIYLTAVSVKLFGLNELAVRLPSAFWGALGVLGMYLLAKELFVNSSTSQDAIPACAGRRQPPRFLSGLHSDTLRVSLPFIVSFLLAVEPWGLFLSRVAVEANVAMVLIIVGVYLFIKGLKNGWWLVVSAVIFGLSLFTYNSARIFVPLLIGALVWIYRGDWGNKGNKKDKAAGLLAGLVFLFFFGAMLVSLFSVSGRARYQWVSLIDEGAIQRINQVRGESNLPGILPILFYNKATYIVTQFTKNYVSHFSPQFLFFKGGSHYQFNIPNFGLLYPVNIPFILIGFWYLFQARSQTSKTIFAWLLLAPIASSITRDSPHTLRALVMLPVWQILAGVGVIGVIGEIRERKAKIILLILYLSLITYHLSLFWLIYFSSYRQEYSWAWQYGCKEVVSFIKENYDRYDKIIVTKKYGEPHEFSLFYWPWDPEEYRKDPNLVRYFRTDWYWVDSFDKFKFVDDWEIEENVKCQMSNVKCLLIISSGNYPQEWEKIETIYFLDGKPAFEILER